MNTRFPIILIVAMSMVIFIPDASACSCAAEWNIKDDFAEEGNVIFSGTVTSIKEQQNTFLVIFEVDQSWKGMPNGITTIKTMTSQSSASCGYNFVEQQSYLVVGHGKWDQTPDVSSCGSTTDLAFANEQILFLNKQSQIDFDDSETSTDTPTFPPPLKQIKSGVSLVDVLCNEGKVPTYKYNAMRVACVSLDTESQLVLRGWSLLRLHMPGDDTSKALCDRYDGNWLEEQRECEYISEEQCSLMGGEFSECESACRNDPSAEICTEQCVLVCSINDNHFPEFKLTFSREGGIAGITQSIVIDSQNHLIKISGFNPKTLGPIYVQDLQYLWDIISENKFFELDTTTYPPIQGSADYFTYTLDVVTSEKRNTISWTDTSVQVPNGIQNIRQEIDRLITLHEDASVTQTNSLEIKINGENQVRRGTTQTLEIQVLRGNNPIEGAQVFLDIEDYGENIIKEFNGYTNSQGYFIFSWEIPQSFDDVETLLAIVDATDNISSKTEVFKFQVYCLPGENNCKVKGN